MVYQIQSSLSYRIRIFLLRLEILKSRHCYVIADFILSMRVSHAVFIQSTYLTLFLLKLHPIKGSFSKSTDAFTPFDRVGWRDLYSSFRNRNWNWRSRIHHWRSFIRLITAVEQGSIRVVHILHIASQWQLCPWFFIITDLEVIVVHQIVITCFF